MTQFKEGYAYVDDETRAVYIYSIRKKRKRLTFTKIAGDGYSSIIEDKYGVRAFENNIDNAIIEYELKSRPTLRPWQVSDEPAYWGDKYDFGDIEIGEVYRSKTIGFDLPVFYKIIGMVEYSGSRRFIAYWHSYNNEYSQYEFNDWLSIIGRKAFPYEIEGIVLPKMKGTIK